MAVWLAPALKAILPHIGTILSVAVPVFTKKSTEATANQELLQQQITELQSAASQNTLHIKELAAQLQQTVTALEAAAAVTQTRQFLVLWASLIALLFSAITLLVLGYYLLMN